MHQIDADLPIPPSADAAPSRWRTTLTVISVVVTCLLVAVGACDHPKPRKTVEQLRSESPTLQKARLRIGVRDDLPFLSDLDPTTRHRSGFEVELAISLAKELGYPEDRIDWVTVTTLSDRLDVLQGNRADMVLASITITAQRATLVEFAGPYQLVPQAVMVSKDRVKQLGTIGDLRASEVKVCTTTGSTSEKALESKDIHPWPEDTNTKCMDGMNSGRYQAFSTDLPILAGLRGREPSRFEILDLAIADGSERIGVATPHGDTAMSQLISYFLNRWQKLSGSATSPWLVAYNHTIGQLLDSKYRSQPLVDEPPGPPDLADYDSKASTQ